jgi:hypothetical protein
MPTTQQRTMTWSYAAAQKVLPYVRRLLADLRGHCIAAWHFRRLAGLDADNQSHGQDMLRHRHEGCEILVELDRLGIVPFDNPLRGIALFPYTEAVRVAGQVLERNAFWIYRDSRDDIDSYILYDDLVYHHDLEGNERRVPEEWKRPAAAPTAITEERP